MSNIVKLYIERFYGIRMPVFDVYINDVLVTPIKVDVISNIDGNRKEVIEFQVNLQQENHLQLKQIDKTDNDLLFIDNNFIDHYIKIREIDIDDIKLETALYFGNSKFTHFMSDAWVQDMAYKGVIIDPIMYNQTDIRLNGVWSLEFKLPIWKWVTEHLIDYKNE